MQRRLFKSLLCRQNLPEGFWHSITLPCLLNRRWKKIFHYRDLQREKDLLGERSPSSLLYGEEKDLLAKRSSSFSMWKGRGLHTRCRLLLLDGEEKYILAKRSSPSPRRRGRDLPSRGRLLFLGRKADLLSKGCRRIRPPFEGPSSSPI